MFRLLRCAFGIWRPGGCCCAAAVVVCLGLLGCTTVGHSDLDFSRLEGFQSEPECSWGRNLRPDDGRSMPHAVTNKGMQIERSLGVR